VRVPALGTAESLPAGMRLRSLLFVPCDRPDRMVKAVQSSADAVILDLEDSVAPPRKADARAALKVFLANDASPTPKLVRINPLDSVFVRADLDALADHRPDGLVLPKAAGRSSIDRLDRWLEAAGLDDIPILPIATEIPAALFELGSYRERSSRLLALTWGAEDLSAAIGASVVRYADGRFRPPYELARSLALFAAHAAGVSAIETVHPDFSDLTTLAVVARRAARDGFSGMLAIHPAQIDVINAAFEPSAEELARARAIVEAFAGQPGVGALSLDGQMVDAPHLRLAERLLARCLPE
jgi:citrate lyase subunit beta/citryl-CoA lyase